MNTASFGRFEMNDKDFQAWVRRQPSCISGDFSEWVDGQGRNEFCHVRRVANGSGMGIKPLFSGVPMTHTEHAMQHQYGEAYLLAAYGIITDDAAAWFAAQAAAYLDRWENVSKFR